MNRFWLLLVAILLCLPSAVQSNTSPATTAKWWCIGTFMTHPYEGCDLRIQALIDKNVADYGASFLVGTFSDSSNSDEKHTENSLGGVITDSTVITITNRSINRNELDLLDGHLVWAIAQIRTTGRYEEGKIECITITVLR